MDPSEQLVAQSALLGMGVTELCREGPAMKVFKCLLEDQRSDRGTILAYLTALAKNKPFDPCKIRELKQLDLLAIAPDVEFNETFALERKTVYSVVNYIAPLNPKNKIDVKSALTFLLYLSNKWTFEEIAISAGISDDLQPLIVRTAKTICLLRRQFKWPDPEQLRIIELGFFSTYRIPTLIGVLGLLEFPVGDVNSVIVQVAVDHNKLVRHMHFVQKTPDTSSYSPDDIFKSSELFCNSLIPPQKFLAADPDKYSGDIEQLLMPFPHSSTNSRVEVEVFNGRLKKAQGYVGQTMTSVLERFPRLANLEEMDLTDACWIIQASLLLHNSSSTEDDIAIY